jgi:hypothetical protein
MDRPLLKSGVLAPRSPVTIRLVLASAALLWVTSCIRPFDDTLSELDPALIDSSLSPLPISEGRAAPRGHILESFGAFGCVSCPGAEARLSPYIHPELGAANYDSMIFIINYHVKFGTIRDPWVIPAAQAVNDRKGFTSLPQAVMDGSNAPYGIREKDVDFAQGEYDTLVARAHRLRDSAFLDLRLDTASWSYDSAAGRARFAFEAMNLSEEAAGPIAFRVLFVKNQSVAIPIYAHRWEVIVTGVADQDSNGVIMAVAGLQARTAKRYGLSVALPSEAPNHVTPPPGGPENPGAYALLLVAENNTGGLLNVRAYRYHPAAP